MLYFRKSAFYISDEVLSGKLLSVFAEYQAR